MIDLSVIIVSYNTKELLRSCLLSLEEQKGITTQVIVVDNASSDGSRDMVKHEFKDVVLVANKQNYGFSKANNLGVAKAKGRYILFLNSDTVVYDHTLATMVDVMDKEKHIGAATCKVLLPGGNLDDASHRGFPTPWNAFCHFSKLATLFPRSRFFSGYSLGWMDKEIPHEIEALAGAFMLVRREAGEDVGWWDEDFFWYGEDLDFCYRLKQKGWPIFYYPHVSILHYKGASGGIKQASQQVTKATSETKRRATYARFEAMRIFYRKHYNKKYPSLLTWSVVQGISLLEWFALRRL